MITWITLFLGLIAGPQAVEVAADEGVARVELFLDGESAGVLAGPPWRLDVDFGDHLLPHELEAVSYGEDGTETARIRQSINLPRPQAEVRIALIEGREGRYRAARLVWEAAADEALVEARFFFDGEPLAAADPRRVPLPDYDPRQLHHLTAEAVFEGDLRGHAVVAFGGRYSGQVTSELTAVAVEWLGEGEVPQAPDREAVAGWFRYRGSPLPVFTVDRPPADVLVVRDRLAAAGLERLGQRVRVSGINRRHRQRMVEEKLAERLGAGLAEGDRLHFLPTVPEWNQDRTSVLFQRSGDLAPHVPGLGWALVRVGLAETPPGPERVADAVAAAGVAAAAGGRARVVLLVTEGPEQDASQHTAAEVRRYLEALQVPLEVWSPEGADLAARTWGEARAVGERGRLREAVEALRGRLDRQFVVWLEGHLLPHQIELAPAARERVRPAG